MWEMLSSRMQMPMSASDSASSKNYGSTEGDAEEGKEKEDELPGGRPHALGRVALAMITFFNVSGGPFTSENTVGIAGPLVAILACIIFPLCYSVPSALLTAEMSTAFPVDAGVAAWVTAAYGPRVGFTEGILFWLQGATSAAAYPIMIVDYMNYAICPDKVEGTSLVMVKCGFMSEHMASFLPDNATMITIVFIVVVSYLNWRGLKLVGPVAVVLVFFLLLPFLVLCMVGLPYMDPSRWFLSSPLGYGAPGDREINWLSLLNCVFWLFNYWDSASTLAGEVKEPERSIPSALSWCMIVTVLNYLLPIAVCTAALPVQQWKTGFWVQAGYELGGHFLQMWIVVVAFVSFVGQFLAGQASSSFELAGMAEIGQLPAILGARNSHGVPMLPLLLFVIVCLSVCFSGSLGVVITLSNSIYCLAELITYATFLELRWRQPMLARPFRIPLNVVGCAMLLIVPFLCSVTIVGTSVAQSWGLGLSLVLAACAGPVLYFLVETMKQRKPELFVQHPVGTDNPALVPAPRTPS
jgi:amino acid transporter